MVVQKHDWATRMLPSVRQPETQKLQPSVRQPKIQKLPTSVRQPNKKLNLGE